MPRNHHLIGLDYLLEHCKNSVQELLEIHRNHHSIEQDYLLENCKNFGQEQEHCKNFGQEQIEQIENLHTIFVGVLVVLFVESGYRRRKRDLDCHRRKRDLGYHRRRMDLGYHRKRMDLDYHKRRMDCCMKASMVHCKLEHCKLEHCRLEHCNLVQHCKLVLMELHRKRQVFCLDFHAPQNQITG